MTIKVKANADGSGLIRADTVVVATIAADGTLTVPKLKTDAPPFTRTWANVAYPNTINASENIASVVRNGVGTFTITFARPFKANNGFGQYSVAVSHPNLGGVGGPEVYNVGPAGFSLMFNRYVAGGDGRVATDPNSFTVLVEGNLA